MKRPKSGLSDLQQRANYAKADEDESKRLFPPSIFFSVRLGICEKFLLRASQPADPIERCPPPPGSFALVRSSL